MELVEGVASVATECAVFRVCDERDERDEFAVVRRDDGRLASGLEGAKDMDQKILADMVCKHQHAMRNEWDTHSRLTFLQSRIKFREPLACDM